MKRVLVVLCLIGFVSCSPKLRSSVIKKLPELSKDELVVVIDIVDEQIILGEKIGEIKATDNGFSNNCSYYENINNLKELARLSGANLVKITKHKPADKMSTCHRLWANIYKVDNAKTYETGIEWSANRKLTWDDFKGEPDIISFPNALAVTNSGFGYEPGSLNLFKKGKLFVRNVFYNNGSWVLPKGRTDYVLRHEQIHFDITEIYTRKLRKALIDANITATDSNRALAIFESIKNEWQKRQEDYDYKTKHGLKKETQEEWEAIVILELARYDLYKTN
ncbi:DUF922 domain-containing protein [Thalassobellus sediminis]|uniref:DUF922 domain-containing protein n=1 Tax=Thalassobellus sediminis TaxID=3367753 RepID=UPI0037966A70